MNFAIFFHTFWKFKDFKVLYRSNLLYWAFSKIYTFPKYTPKYINTAYQIFIKFRFRLKIKVSNFFPPLCIQIECTIFYKTKHNNYKSSNSYFNFYSYFVVFQLEPLFFTKINKNHWKGNIRYINPFRRGIHFWNKVPPKSYRGKCAVNKMKIASVGNKFFEQWLLEEYELGVIYIKFEFHLKIIFLLNHFFILFAEVFVAFRFFEKALCPYIRPSHSSWTWN